MAPKEQRSMGYVVLLYVIVLVVDVSFGSILIVWKCAVREVVDDCKLAVGGTVGSVVVWLLIMLICPCFMTCCEFPAVYGDAADAVKKCAKYVHKLRSRKSREIHVQNEIYRPTTTTLQDDGSGKCEATSDIIGSYTDVNSKLLASQNVLPNDVVQERVYMFNENEHSSHKGALLKYLDHDVP